MSMDNSLRKQQLPDNSLRKQQLLAVLSDVYG